MNALLSRKTGGRLTPLTIGILSILSSADAVAGNELPAQQEIAQNVAFDPSFLNLEKSDTVDLSRFANGSAALPGQYRVAVYVNNVLVSNTEIEFKARADKTVFPCLTKTDIKSIDFNYGTLPKDVLAPLEQGEPYIDLQQQLPQAQINFDNSEQRLDILIPQIYMNTLARGSVSPALWDSGVPAATLGYNLNGYHSESSGQDYNSFYAGLTAGMNIGAWYLRHNGSYNWIQDGSSQYTTINTYVQRDIPAIKGRVLLGESNTTGQVFDTLSFSGAQLASDDRMLPESQRGYAPDIRGIARTSAKVTVRQGGQVIYQTTVAPGEFLINDLYPTGYGGDLEVSVREADGSTSVFLVPYAAVTQLLRPGANRYEVVAGKARYDQLNDKPALYQATYQHGLTNVITGYAGVQASQDYYALQLGAAFGMPIGAISVDVTQARTHLDNGKEYTSDGSMSGQSYRVSYNKLITETNSNLSLAAYRFSTNGYMDYITAMQTRDVIARGYDGNTIWRAKSRATLTASQGLVKGWGQLYISASTQNYWNKSGNDQQYQMGYSNQYKQLNYSLSANRTYSGMGSGQTNYLLSFSVPLGRTDKVNTPQMHVDLNHDTNGNTGEQLGISGNAGETRQFSYGITAMNANQGAGTSGSLNGQYRSPMTMVGATYSAGQGYQSASASLNGSIVAHPGGVTLTPYVAETLAVVEAKGAAGAAVSSYPGVYIDRWGYAVVPYLNPYQMNEISIDPKGSSSDVELDNTTQKVAPYAGAVVMLKYNTKHGTPLLIVATLDGSPVPFGADVLDSKGNSVGSVGQGGQIYARVAQERDSLRVKWGDGPQMQCRVGYILMPTQPSKQQSALQRFNAECHSIDVPTGSPLQQVTQRADGSSVVSG